MTGFPAQKPFVSGDVLTPEAAIYINDLQAANEALAARVATLESTAAKGDGTTGGTGSAGAGAQYVEIKVDGTTYKVLHDGTV